MKIISPSLLNSDTYQIKEQFEALEKCGINYIHIDITDGHFVPMISFGANTVKDLRKHTDFVLDCHLMVENPENLIPVIADAGADIITVHTEATKHIYRSIQTIKKCGKKAGIAINPGTPVSMIKEILPMADLVLCMTTNPGVFGESFIPSVADKVKNLRSETAYCNYTTANYNYYKTTKGVIMIPTNLAGIFIRKNGKWMNGSLKDITTFAA